MSVEFSLTASERTDIGKGASRRLRRLQNKVPAIIYGGNKSPLAISLEANKLEKALSNEAFYSHILTIDVAGKKEKVVMKDLQRVHAKKSAMHVDFMRVSASDQITMRVPIHFTHADKCPGAKAGGLITHQAIDVEVKCRADKLPEFIEVDLSSLQADSSIHLSEIKLPKGVEIPSVSDDKGDAAVVSVSKARGSAGDAAEDS